MSTPRKRRLSPEGIRRPQPKSYQGGHVTIQPRAAAPAPAAVKSAPPAPPVKAAVKPPAPAVQRKPRHVTIGKPRPDPRRAAADGERDAIAWLAAFRAAHGREPTEAEMDAAAEAATAAYVAGGGQQNPLSPRAEQASEAVGKVIAAIIIVLAVVWVANAMSGEPEPAPAPAPPSAWECSAEEPPPGCEPIPEPAKIRIANVVGERVGTARKQLADFNPAFDEGEKYMWCELTDKWTVTKQLDTGYAEAGSVIHLDVAPPAGTQPCKEPGSGPADDYDAPNVPGGGDDDDDFNVPGWLCPTRFC